MPRKKSELSYQSTAPVHCAHETCDLPARVKVKTPTGWANFCEPHYVRFHDDQARARCAELGLLKRPDETSLEFRKRMMAYIRERARPKTFEDAVQAEDEWSKTA